MKIGLYDKVVDGFIRGGVIELEDREIYRFGLGQIAILLLNLATTMVIGILYGMLPESILFCAAYLPLRSNAGGYHAKTWQACYLFSSVMTAAILSVIRLVAFHGLVCCIMAAAGGLIILLLAPVESKNKPLDSTEKAVYRRRSRMLLGGLAALFLLGLFAGWSAVSATVATAVSALGVMLLAGLGSQWKEPSA